MKTLHFDIHINTSKKKVWDIMLDKNSFQTWTAEFSEGSYYEGSWEKGDRIKFLVPSGDGMTSMIAENRSYEYISIKHLGCINNGIEDTTSAAVQSWTPAFENYIFTEKDGTTQLHVEMDVAPEFEKFMQTAWPKALAKLKEICEAA